MHKTYLFAALWMLAGSPAVMAQSAGERLNALFEERFQWQMLEFPEMAMARGDYSHADRVTDRSLQAIEQRHQQTVRHLEQLRAIPRDALSTEERLNYDLFERLLQEDIEDHRHRDFLAAIGPRSGLHHRIAQMHERVRFASAKDYEDYLTRLEQTPRQVDHCIEKLKTGMAEGRTPPRVTIERIPKQFEALAAGGLEALAEPFEQPPADIEQGARAALRQRFTTTSLPAVKQALQRLGRYVADEYLPSCRTSIAARDWPDGEAYYAHQLRKFTTTGLTARQIHELGLAEVARIRQEMMWVILSSDYLELYPQNAELSEAELFKAFVKYLRTDSRFYHRSEQELLTGYRDICKRIDAIMPKLFKTLPRLPYGVRKIPDFMAPTQTTAYYSHGDIRNAEPGYFYANTYALDQRPRYEMIALAMHEAVPGHHHQIALAQELTGLPEFRKDAWFTAFGEGWALYSERLGLEHGLYDDPYDNFGRLLYEMWRACRLVVDPGMHALGWSREQAVQFMLDNTALSELNVNNEIDRYIYWPGQACAYKIGELKIRELRQLCEERLGRGFDLREFHDVILGAGSIPLPLLEQRVQQWLATAAGAQS